MTTTSALENISSFIPLLHSWETLKSFFLEIERAKVGAGGCKVMKETLPRTARVIATPGHVTYRTKESRPTSATLYKYWGRWRFGYQLKSNCNNDRTW